MRSPAPPAPKRKPRPRYWLRRLLALLIMVSPLLAWWGWSTWKRVPLKAEGTAPRVAAGPVYVALMGVDERADDVGRSDTLMLLRLDSDAGRVDVINVPRDTQVSLKPGQVSKINAAYSTGGATLTVDVLKDLLGIPTPYYVRLNFQAFEQIVDSLGGITLNVEKHYVYDDPYQNLHIDLQPGPQTLDGAHALQYVRLRYDGVTNSDIARIERQQKFLQALKDKLSSPAYWSHIPDLVSTLRKNIATNIPEADQLKLARDLWSARGNLSMRTLPGTPDDATGNWIMDQNGWKGVVDQWTQSPAPKN